MVAEHGPRLRGLACAVVVVPGAARRGGGPRLGPGGGGFLSWLRIGRTVEHALTAPSGVPSAETLHARLAALISFYQWQEAVHSVPVAGRLLRGRTARMPSRGLLAHLDGGRRPGPSSLVKVRRRRAGRPPLLLPQEIQAIIDGCVTWDDAAGNGQATCVTGCCSRCWPRAG